MVARLHDSGSPLLGFHLIMGKTPGEKIRNYLINLREHRTAVAMGVAEPR
jgi:hypothetical protein